MDRQLKPGMAELTSTRLAARKRAHKLRRRRNRIFFFAGVFIAVFVGILIVKPVTAPEGLSTTIAMTLPTQEILETQESTPTKMALEGTPEPEKSKEVKATLPTQAQIFTYPKGTPILYYAQSGDSLNVVAVHFGVDVNEITSPSDIPEEGFIPEGQLLLIPARLDEISSTLKLMPDTEIINSPSTVNFDIEEFTQGAGGYLSNYKEYLGTTGITTGADIIKRVALEYSINPRLLLSLLEYQSGWVYGEPINELQKSYPFGYINKDSKDLYRQAVWAAGEIASGYYGWREGTIVAITFPDKSILRLAPELNSGTVGIMAYFSKLLNLSEWAGALYTETGLIDLHENMFGNPWIKAQEVEPLFSPAIEQPEMILPFEIGKIWALTGGPHAAWGAAEVRGALDFAPPSSESGCVESFEWVVASVSGLVVRSGDGSVVIDMDEDGYEQTGWNVVYMHIATKDRIPLGTIVKVGDRIGHPSCEGGRATGTHVHITRKYNGEWIPADGPLAFILSGWKAKAGSTIYTGWLMKDGQIVRASQLSSAPSHIQRKE